MNKATASVVSAIKQVYGIDISERVIIGNKRNFFTFGTDGMDGNDFNNVSLSVRGFVMSLRVTRNSLSTLNKPTAPNHGASADDSEGGCRE